MQQNSSPIDFGFSFDTPVVKPQPIQQQPVQQPIQQQPVQQQPQVNPLYPTQQQPVQNTFNGLNLGFNNPTTLPQQQQPLYGQQAPYGYGQQQQGQYGMMSGYPQQPPGGLYGQPYPQPMGQGMNMGGYNMQGMAFNQTPQYQQPATQYNQQQSWGQNISLSTPQPAQQQGFGNISLQTTTNTKK